MSCVSFPPLPLVHPHRRSEVTDSQEDQPTSLEQRKVPSGPPRCLFGPSTAQHDDSEPAFEQRRFNGCWANVKKKKKSGEVTFGEGGQRTKLPIKNKYKIKGEFSSKKVAFLLWRGVGFIVFLGGMDTHVKEGQLYVQHQKFGKVSPEFFAPLKNITELSIRNGFNTSANKILWVTKGALPIHVNVYFRKDMTQAVVKVG